ncbi:MFS transporter [Peribacillus butanolivorans]|uniref:MFS transporter n=1 Tax=Peribacillus butanolivorans TaxID=421767 RepID=UPI0030C907E2
MRWIVLVILFFGFLINFADKSVVGLAVGPLMEELNLSYAQWGLVGSSFFWIFPVAAVFMGFITDKVSPKKIIAFMLLAWSLLQFGGYLIGSFATLLLYRIFLGFAEGGYAPASLRQLFAYFPPSMRARVTTIFTLGSTVGAYAVAPLVVLLLQVVGWRHSFAIMGLFSLVLVVVWVMVIPKKTPELEELEVMDDSTPKRKVPWSELYPVLLSRTSIFTLFMTFGFFCLSSWMQIWMPLYFLEVTQISQMGMAYATLTVGLTSMIVSLSMATISDRVFKKTQSLREGRVKVTGIGMLIAGLIFGSLYFTNSVVWTTLGITLAYGFSFLILSTSHIIIGNQLPERTSTLSGVIVAFSNIAAALCAMAVGFIIQNVGVDNSIQGFKYSFLMIATIMVIVAILFIAYVHPEGKKKKNKLVNIEKEASSS